MSIVPNAFPLEFRRDVVAVAEPDPRPATAAPGPSSHSARSAARICRRPIATERHRGRVGTQRGRTEFRALVTGLLVDLSGQTVKRLPCATTDDISLLTEEELLQRGSHRMTPVVMSTTPR